MTKNKSKTCGKAEGYGKSGDLLHERVIAVAGYIVENNATVRQTAKEFGISKSTVHMVVIKQNGLGSKSYG